ncbi:unnamed protein product [Rotaria sp. Silwood2]|nr:unnamed protein product [Rotaria sp. Silwood2]CAF4709470.1 unnamed protein product [Rotaria sp. Silwood2]
MIFVLIGFVNIIPDNKDVLISGCDTVVGHILAIELDKQGFNVFAGVHIPDNKTILKAKLSTRAKIFHLDITKEEDIDTVFELVQKKTNTLHGLINNAGIITHGYIDWTPIELMRKIMNSRVVNICSATGFFAFPNTCAYSASKYALESFSDSLMLFHEDFSVFIHCKRNFQPHAILYFKPINTKLDSQQKSTTLS